MTIQITDIASVSEKLESLGLGKVNGLSLLPDNLDDAKSPDELLQQTEADTVRTLLRTNGIPYAELFDDEHQPSYIQNYSYEWYGPTLLLSASLLTQDPNLTTVILGLLTNYLSDLFKGGSQGKVSLNIVIESADGSYKKIAYEGSPEDLNSVVAVVERLK
ncbi:hypothetical protein PQR12_21775 [Paraburkholderia nemoris]|uniref:hypothetical protein n=1 Tax=Paraburkholderia nemoris TaxID=2793076 RepID=UPI0038BCB4DD